MLAFCHGFGWLCSSQNSSIYCFLEADSIQIVVIHSKKAHWSRNGFRRQGIECTSQSYHHCHVMISRYIHVSGLIYLRQRFFSNLKRIAVVGMKPRLKPDRGGQVQICLAWVSAFCPRHRIPDICPLHCIPDICPLHCIPDICLLHCIPDICHRHHRRCLWRVC